MDIFYKELDPKYNIIDIRDEYEYDIDHFYGAKNIPMNELLINHKLYLNKSEIYYIYCSSGYRSKKTCNILKVLGYNVINVKDGFKNK